MTTEDKLRQEIENLLDTFVCGESDSEKHADDFMEYYFCTRCFYDELQALIEREKKAAVEKYAASQGSPLFSEDTLIALPPKD